jgi:hypothetical protein
VTEPCSNPEVSQFNFWLGDWDLEWPAEQMGGADGDTGTGANRIERVLGGCVVEENFSTSDGSFLGRSHSVYDPAAGFWRQTWVDNQGGYLLFAGGMDGDTMELRTPVVERDGKLAVNRMVFRDIATDSLSWDWQGSRDGGESWDDLWNISYRRRTG